MISKKIILFNQIQEIVQAILEVDLNLWFNYIILKYF